MASTVDLDRIEETESAQHVLDKQLDKLATLVRSSKRTVFFTGAGVSTSAGVGDYRGPTGAWTMNRIRDLQKLELRGVLGASEAAELKKLRYEASKKQKAAPKKVPMLDAQPTLSHMAIATLIRKGLASYVVTTNLDGIHRKSGLKAHSQISNLHGCVYAERCTNPSCGYDFERNYETRRHQIHVHDHHVSICPKCGNAPPSSYTGRVLQGSPTGSDSNGYVDNHLVGTQDTNVGTKDTHINFGEFLDPIDWNDAERACKGADLCVVAGTSMSLRHITHFPFMAKKTVIVNLQPTPDDAKATLRIFAKCDPVFAGLMTRLGVEVDPTPIWQPADAVPLGQLPKDLHPYYMRAAHRLDKLTRRRLAEKAATAAGKTASSNSTTASQSKPQEELAAQDQKAEKTETKAGGMLQSLGRIVGGLLGSSKDTKPSMSPAPSA